MESSQPLPLANDYSFQGPITSSWRCIFSSDFAPEKTQKKKRKKHNPRQPQQKKTTKETDHKGDGKEKKID